MDNQLRILAESLDKKIKVLVEIQEYNKKQEKAFLAEKVELNDFDEAVEEKGRLIEKLKSLDEGFEIMYEKLAEQLRNDREKYTEEIKELQEKIKQVTELGVSIEVQEKRNKQLVEQYFAKERSSIGRNRKASKVAYDYYKRANNTSYVQPQFYDDKK